MAQARISKARGAVLNLLKKSYIERDSVAIVAFRGKTAEVLLPPSRSILRARRVLDSLSVGGGTPLSAGLACSLEVAANATIQHAGRLVLLLFTDGGANVPLKAASPVNRETRQRIIADEISELGARLHKARVQTFVVASQNHFVSETQTQTIAELLRASHVRLAAGEQLKSDTVLHSGYSA
jgi:magnesium chelatase subunit D